MTVKINPALMRDPDKLAECLRFLGVEVPLGRLWRWREAGTVAPSELKEALPLRLKDHVHFEALA